jgi:hypothetical protein
MEKISEPDSEFSRAKFIRLYGSFRANGIIRGTNRADSE